MSASATDVKRMKAIVKRVLAADVAVRYMPGWETAGRPYAFNPRGVIDHHDASTAKAGEWGSLGVIVKGRPSEGIPGPLSQFQVARCLKVPQIAVVAAGRANHAGAGGGLTVGGLWIPKDRGNELLYGVEKANDGISEKATAAADYAADVLFAAILEEVA